jgi:Wzt C-terminal domain
VERFCDRGLVLERGALVDEGAPERITRTYGELNFGHARQGKSGEAAAVRVAAAWCEDSNGERIVTARQGVEVAVCVELEFGETVEDPVFSVVVRNEVRHTILVLTTNHMGESMGRFEAGARCTFRFTFQNQLAPSRYTFTPSVGADGRGHDYFARSDDLAALVVQAPVMTGGVVDLPFEFEMDDR